MFIKLLGLESTKKRAGLEKSIQISPSMAGIWWPGCIEVDEEIVWDEKTPADRLPISKYRKKR